MAILAKEQKLNEGKSERGEKLQQQLPPPSSLERGSMDFGICSFDVMFLFWFLICREKKIQYTDYTAINKVVFQLIVNEQLQFVSTL